MFGNLPSDLGLERDGSFSLNVDGWTANVVRINDDSAVDSEMAAFVAARPGTLPITTESVDRLRGSLHLVFSLAASREIGVGPAAGIDSTGEVVWADWSAPKYRPGKSGIRWCPQLQGGPVLQALAELAIKP